MNDSSSQHNTYAHTDEHHAGLSWFAIAAVVLIVALGVWLLAVRDAEMPFEPTSIPGVLGFQGEITAVDYQENTLTLHQNKRVENEDGEMEIVERTFSVSWDDETEIRRFVDARAVSANISAQGSEVDFRPGRGMIVVPRQMRDDAIVAEEIFVLPGTMRARAVEEE